MMKNLCILFLLMPLISCSAQNIVPYDSDERFFVPNSGDYYKDTNNDFNIYEGEWKWEDITTNSSLIIILKKEEGIDNSDGYIYDLLVGEYKYIQGGNELADSLLSIDNPNITGRQHKISGFINLTKYNYPQCNDCTENEKRIQVTIAHNNHDAVYGELILRHFVEDGLEKLKIIVRDGAWLSQDNNAPEDIDIPFGEYIMIKQ